MSAAPLTRWERDAWIKWAAEGNGDLALERILATLQAAEERAERMHQMLVRISQWDPIARRYLAALTADDAAPGER